MSRNFLSRRIDPDRKGEKLENSWTLGSPARVLDIQFCHGLAQTRSGYIQVPDILSSPVLVGPVWIDS